MENNMELKKVKKVELSYDPTIPLLEISSKITKPPVWKDIYIPMSIAVLFIIAKTWKQPKYPWTDKWITIFFLCSSANLKYISVLSKAKLFLHACSKLYLFIFSQIY